ncbi:metallophosphoesterase family protein [Curtobacterium flaccumfaciens]|uniref:metallophosphoesterase family protein n=1 Tax=Curtobacterium flaccumfaciens TaxID=2035 RepID=UPI001BDE62A1|nr:metallophosphoesterase [Curtobacterium flaccumfaciens]MBT1595673.1 metallophosphoesterase [Curtobacterium flaccumfaciens pv. flaccumfaciens]
MSDRITLPEIRYEETVAVSSDWESIIGLAMGQVDRIHAARPDVCTVLHLGDLRLDPHQRSAAGAGRYLRHLDDALHESGIRRLLVTPGNHDDWTRLSSWWEMHQLPAYRVASRIWFLRPGTRFTLAGRTILSFGGASALDRAHQPWWAESMPDAELAKKVSEEGPCDVLLTHEAVDSGIAAVRTVLDGPSRWPTNELHDSARSRTIVTELRDAVRPAVALHGHLHRPGLDRGAQGLTVSLAGRTVLYNAGFLNLTDLTWTWLEDEE